MPHDIIIAIDGLASSGKSTLAKQLAAELHYRYVDSGAFYRAATLFLVRNQVDWKDGASLQATLKKISIGFEYDPATHSSKVLLNGENVESEIRGMKISESVSEVSTIPAVRTFINEKLREFGGKKKIVMDGRDIGTVVFPQAELKIFLTADEKIRSTRRFREMQDKGTDVTEDQVTKNLSGRDLIDSTRTTAPLKKAVDAVVLDNSNLTLQEQFEMALKFAMERMV